MKFRRLLVAGILGIFWLFANVNSATAFGIMPKQDETGEARSKFDYVMNRGETFSDSFIINNYDDVKKTFIIEGLDAVNSADGIYGLVDNESENQDIGTWINLDYSNITLFSNTSVEIPFTISVPLDASVGEHHGGFAIYEKTPFVDDTLNIRTRVGIRIYLTIPGDINRAIDFRSVDYSISDGKAMFNIKAHNNSNVSVEPDLDISIATLFGKKTQNYPSNGIYFSDQSIDIKRELDTLIPKFGYYPVTISFKVPAVEQQNLAGDSVVLPGSQYSYSIGIWRRDLSGYGWVMFLLILWLLFRLVVYVLDYRLRNLNLFVYKLKKNDTLRIIATKHNISFKTLVSVNNIPWPYMVNLKSTIVIPTNKKSIKGTSKIKNKPRLNNFWRYIFSWKLTNYRVTNLRGLDKQ